MRMKFITFLAALCATAPALAANNVALSSAVFVERTLTGNDGKPRVVLQAPVVVTPGDQLIYVLKYQNMGAAPATNFVVTNPLPGAVAFQGSPDPQALVSIDGGKNWGRLHSLKVREDDGRWRNARPDDVTHVRWAMAKPIPAGAQGKLSFRGLVR